ncbi:MAG: hypothetical protein ACREQ7_17005 [Candidatus Binatia bacterium]
MAIKKSYKNHEIEITCTREQSGRWSASVSILPQPPDPQRLGNYSKGGFASAAEAEQALWEWATAKIDGSKEPPKPNP